MVLRTLTHIPSLQRRCSSWARLCLEEIVARCAAPRARSSRDESSFLALGGLRGDGREGPLSIPSTAGTGPPIERWGP